jgi:hypothetical protein
MERSILRGFLWFVLCWSVFSMLLFRWFATFEQPESAILKGEINAAVAWIAAVVSIGFLACSAGPRSASAEPEKTTPSRPKMGPYPDRPGSQPKPRRTWDE